MLPPTLLQELDLTKLERVNGSYVSPELQETFSDVVYLCPLKNGWYAVQITFIFEHKSKVESRPHLQLLRYMLDAWSAQLMQIKSEKQKKTSYTEPNSSHPGVSRQRKLEKTQHEQLFWPRITTKFIGLSASVRLCFYPCYSHEQRANTGVGEGTIDQHFFDDEAYLEANVHFTAPSAHFYQFRGTA